MKKVAILGATGYIGRALVSEFAKHASLYDLILVSRSKEKLERVLRLILDQVSFRAVTYSDFSEGSYDVIINCTGISNISSIKNDPDKVLTTTETVDYLILDYLSHNPNSQYIAISSGAVHKDTQPLTGGSSNDPLLYYALAKQEMEARHRALPNFDIVDVRIFSFVSRYIDKESHFFMSDVIQAVITKNILQTSDSAMVRDYVCASDLFECIKKVIDKRGGNIAFDMYSKSPVSKQEILKYLQEKFDVKYEVKINSHQGISDDIYVPDLTKPKVAETVFGYVPKNSSLEAIEEELLKLKK